MSRTSERAADVSTAAELRLKDAKTSMHASLILVFKTPTAIHLDTPGHVNALH